VIAKNSLESTESDAEAIGKRLKAIGKRLKAIDKRSRKDPQRNCISRCRTVHRVPIESNWSTGKHWCQRSNWLIEMIGNDWNRLKAIESRLEPTGKRLESD
jgi:hypothetical protein